MESTYKAPSADGRALLDLRADLRRVMGEVDDLTRDIRPGRARNLLQFVTGGLELAEQLLDRAIECESFDYSNSREGR